MAYVRGWSCKRRIAERSLIELDVKRTVNAGSIRSVSSKLRKQSARIVQLSTVTTPMTLVAVPVLAYPIIPP